MAEIKEIRISGFRGIRACLPLSFKRGDSYQSMVIYGRNGTGKSSITDAWEWLQTEKIEHLRREGAGPNSYPHKFAKSGETFIEIDFEKKELGTIRAEFDFARITKSRSSGNIDTFRALAPHPCFIRFEDLTRFVFLTKSEKFDALARLMGFMPQVELQKSLRRVLRNYSDSIDVKKKELIVLETQLRDILIIGDLTAEQYLSEMNKILEKHGIDPASLFTDLITKGKSLNDKVVNDPQAKDLANLKLIQDLINIPPSLEEYLNSLAVYVSSLKSFLSTENQFSKMLLLELYEQGEKVVSQVDQKGNKVFQVQSESGSSIDICPLCGQTYEGNLVAHIATELDSLRLLKQSRDASEVKRKELQRELPPKSNYSLSFQKLGVDFPIYQEKFSLTSIISTGDDVDKVIHKLEHLLALRIENVSDSTTREIEEVLMELREKLPIFNRTKNELNHRLIQEMDVLKNSGGNREELVKDNTNFQVALKLWGEIGNKKATIDNHDITYKGAEEIIDDYVQSSIANVEDRFRIISDDVREFFEILEQDTEGLKGASLKLLTDEDRAVELQINFHGDDIFPAYKYLSESQLNSFGLSVFLASAKYFNSNFKFIILDDIINSFDGYKRPRISELLKTKFSQHQILLLTHDNVWSDRLFETFPACVKKRFIRWELNHGPVDVDGFAPLEEIKKLVDEDKPVQAGSLMGPFLERQFQELCEKFEVMVKYTRLNEYTLDPLLDRFRVRAQEKLGKDHNFVKAILDLYDETGFRNLCAHWKDPQIQLTSQEMKAVIDKWNAIDKLVRCQSPDCLNWLVYDQSIPGFVCPCGKTRLEKAKSS